MFCPKCSEAQISEDVRFCKRCGFRLEAVQDLIASEATSKARPEGILPKQKDISIGATLMFVGSIVAMLWAQVARGNDGDVLPQVYFILAFTLGFILLLFHPLLGTLKKLFSDTEEGKAKKRASPSAKQRNGINLGALLMFLGTIKAMTISTLEDNAGKRANLTLAIATAIFLMLLVIRWLVERVYRLFSNNSAADKQEPAERVTGDLALALKERASGLGLPVAQHDGAIPVETLTSRQVEMAQPPSVTDRTTDLLGKG